MAEHKESDEFRQDGQELLLGDAGTGMQINTFNNETCLNQSKEQRGSSKDQNSAYQTTDVQLATDIFYPDDDLDAVVDMLTEEEKMRLFQVTNECFQIIGPENEEEDQEIDVLDEPEVRMETNVS